MLKPYFAKQLKSKKIIVVIYAEFKHGRIVSQNAYSEDIERIDRDLIECVRFNFVDHYFIKNRNKNWDQNKLLNFKDLNSDNKLYASEDEFINELVKYKNTKHYKQLKYLSGNHCGNVLKIKFVLKPFSFVFLLEGNNNYHIVLETLDTEEATYIWHIPKEINTLKSIIFNIEKDIEVIKNNGRQYFLNTQPKNFSKIVHDYSDERKGFVIWKNELEEKLY